MQNVISQKLTQVAKREICLVASVLEFELPVLVIIVVISLNETQLQVPLNAVSQQEQVHVSLLTGNL